MLNQQGRTYDPVTVLVHSLTHFASILFPLKMYKKNERNIGIGYQTHWLSFDHMAIHRSPDFQSSLTGCAEVPAASSC